ncbi:MAG: phosphoenolpyruvate hydrolase family protein [Planctomycetes bacterium]|nr:phosphoenolpyruvate hydrolase family protein [Planctomycetota bacterium]
MKPDLSRRAILARLRERIARREPIIGGGAGTGISAKSEEAGGIDLIVIYNSGRYRMAGRGSLAGLMPYGNANQIVKEMAYEVLPVVRHTPVLAGVCGTDPFMMPELFLEELAKLGFAGIQNFPTVGLIEGELRSALEDTEMGFEKEVEIVALAHRMELLTTPYAFNADEARRMARAGADIVVAHMGCTSGGSIGSKSVKPLEVCLARIREIVAAVREVRDDVIVLCHGGPLAEPLHAQHVFDHVDGVHGFYGASSTERLPTEIAIRDTIRAFKQLRLR